MSKLYIPLALASLLVACGGGGSDHAAVASTTAAITPPVAVATTPGVTPAATIPVVTPVSTAATLAAMPAVTTGAFTATSGSLNLSNNAQVMNMMFSGPVKLNITGQLNKVWVDAKAAGGSTVVNGSQNTIVFRPGVDTTVDVTGSANTFILAAGSPIKIEGSGAAASTVQYYQVSSALTPGITPR